MKRYRIFRRGKTYYIHDAQTGKQESLRTQSKKDALRVLNAKQEAQEQREAYTRVLNVIASRRDSPDPDEIFNPRLS